MQKYTDLTRAVSRHSVSYMVLSLTELFRHYGDFDPLDLLIIHAVLNANVINIMRDPDLDKRFGSIRAVEPDAIKLGVSRAALSRSLGLPLGTVRQRVERLKKRGILLDGTSGLIVLEANAPRFGNNHELQLANIDLVGKLIRDLKRAGINGLEDL